MHDGSGVDAEGVIDGGQQFSGVDGVGVGCATGFVGLAEYVTALDARAGDDTGVAVGPVIAAVGVVVVAAGGEALLWAAAKFADAQHERFVEQAALIHISEHPAEAAALVVGHGIGQDLWVTTNYFSF